MNRLSTYHFKYLDMQTYWLKHLDKIIRNYFEFYMTEDVTLLSFRALTLSNRCYLFAVKSVNKINR